MHYRDRRFAVARAIEGDSVERLNVDVTFTRLSLWPDGGLWFQVAEPGPSRVGGWVFLFSFHGTAANIPPVELVRTFEESFPLRHTPIIERRRFLLDLWQHAEPVVDHDAS